MTPEQVLSCRAKVLTQTQREFYFAHGYLLLERFVDADWINRLNAVTGEVVEESRQVRKSDRKFDLEPDHRPDRPRLRRLSSPVDHHPLYWEFASKHPIGDVVADLVGPDVKYHHSKLNFKWSEGGAAVEWHQDINGWPHTNYSPLTVGTYLHDTGPEQGPLGVIPGSHQAELFDHSNNQGQWTGKIDDKDLARVPLDKVIYLEGPAGSVTIHNCRLVHGSKPNLSGFGRPLLLNTFSSADAFTYTPNPIPSPHEGEIIRGKRARWAHHDPRPCQIPPDWSGGYTSLFAIQQEGKVAAY